MGVEQLVIHNAVFPELQEHRKIQQLAKQHQKHYLANVTKAIHLVRHHHFLLLPETQQQTQYSNTKTTQ